jgi:hypothetical protein
VTGVIEVHSSKPEPGGGGRIPSILRQQKYPFLSSVPARAAKLFLILGGGCGYFINIINLRIHI